MAPRRTALLSIALAAFSPVAALAADLCPAWGEPEIVGRLNTWRIGEASGLEFSPAHPDRLYHNNDSGGGPYIYVTGADATDTRRVEIAGFEPRDVEAIAAGPCGEESCLFLADIGDNGERRARVHIVVLEEPGEPIPPGVTPRTIVSAAYPDGPHNAEAAAVHPNGDLFVLTKEHYGASGLYRLSAAQLAEGGEQAFSLVGAIPLRPIMGGGRPPLSAATAMDIAPDGTRFVVLSYAGAVEIAADLSKPLNDPAGWREGVDFRRIATLKLQQAEAVAYAEDGRSILYDTEQKMILRDAKLMRQQCLE
jgi:hypothetical protein